ncbi:MAG: PIN domain-containing protein [Pseudonocardiales bacterium]|nr:PIN domain-containing protein [Pseudonocardiales bacterium]
MGTLRALADTSLFIGLEQGRISSIRHSLTLSMITIGELRLGVLNAADPAARAARLRTLQSALALDPLPVDDQVADAWAELRVALRAAGRRLDLNDAWIAATAIAHGLPLVTQDRDYRDVPGLDVVAL